MPSIVEAIHRLTRSLSLPLNEKDIYRSSHDTSLPYTEEDMNYNHPVRGGVSHPPIKRNTHRNFISDTSVDDPVSSDHHSKDTSYGDIVQTGSPLSTLPLNYGHCKSNIGIPPFGK
ncbi:hypothetical protein ACJMK2_027114 [Sinanodonta woodiana]|uniref:Uncharacterized protein n=1 Tax=Sinanodonta woodiana TaxID=1069815 RepID=A0ABD3XLR1_SINWO